MDTEEFIVWDTPLKFGKSIGLVSLLDDGELTITVQDNRDDYRRVKFSFGYTVIYRNIDELYRCSDTINKTKSWTVIVKNSRWLAEFRKKESLIEELMPEVKHYQIITEFDVIDVLSETEPNIEEINPDEKYAGPAPVLYHPEDKEEIDKALEPYRKPNK